MVDAGREEREFTLSVPGQFLTDTHFKYQDAPALCFAKLTKELSLETPEQMVPLQMTISEGELQKYMQDHYPAKGKLFKPW